MVMLSLLMFLLLALAGSVRWMATSWQKSEKRQKRETIMILSCYSILQLIELLSSLALFYFDIYIIQLDIVLISYFVD